MAARFILPALAFAGAAIAQCSGDLNIVTSADAQAISSCSTYDGSVTIDSSASGTIAINGVKQITGDLTCNNATQLTSISADQLNTIGGTFGLASLTILSTLQFNSLDRVNRVIWVALPALQGLNFNQGISEANQVQISNTQLNTLAGIELTQVGSMDINNNPYLNTINVNNLENVTQSLSFSANGRQLEIQFPNLENAANLTFRNVSSIDMPSLATVGGAMGFYSNSFDSFAAPNLTQTGQTIAFVDSSALSNLSFPMLTTVGGGLLLANNSKLDAINAFPALQTIVGAIDFRGVFSSVSWGALKDVRGGANIETSSNNQTICDIFNQASQAQVIKGKTNCAVSQANSQTNGSVTGSSGSSSSSSSAANPAAFDPSAPLTGIAAFIAAILFL